MAKHLDPAELNRLSVERYKDVRLRLRSGDLLFASGDYFVSKAIQKLTGSPWSHVGILFRVDSIDRVLLLESVEDMGVRFAPVSKYIHDYEDGSPYRGAIVVARSAAVSKDILVKLAQFGTDELTRPYDRDEIAKIVARIAIGRGRAKRDREYICSELVFECFRAAGYDFAYNAKGFVSPEDIWVDSEVSLLARIR